VPDTQARVFELLLKGIFVRGLFCCVALSAVLTGSLLDRANAQTSNAPKSPIPPRLAKECAVNITKEIPTVKIVGPFFHSAFSSPLSRYFAEGRVAVIAAPTTITGIGSTARVYSGCIYDIRDGALVFRKVADFTQFPGRKKLEPGEK
jgi:hypothetical protein